MWLPHAMGGSARVLARAPHEDVADLVDGDGHAGLLGPADDEVAALPIEIGQREAANAALRGRADARELHERAPETVTVDGSFDAAVGRLMAESYLVDGKE